MRAWQKYSLYALILGVIEVLNIVLIANHDRHVGGAISLVIELGFLALTIVGGRAVKVDGGRPVPTGALMGGLYGVVESIPGLFTKFAVSSFTGTNVTKAQAVHYAQFANSASGHLSALVGNGIVYAIVGLIFAAVGGASIRKPRNQ